MSRLKHQHGSIQSLLQFPLLSLTPAQKLHFHICMHSRRRVCESCKMGNTPVASSFSPPPGMAQYVLGLMKDGNAGEIKPLSHFSGHTHTHTHTHTHSLKWWHIHSVTPASCVINRRLKMGKKLNTVNAQVNSLLYSQLHTCSLSHTHTHSHLHTHTHTHTHHI